MCRHVCRPARPYSISADQVDWPARYASRTHTLKISLSPPDQARRFLRQSLLSERSESGRWLEAFRNSMPKIRLRVIINDNIPHPCANHTDSSGSFNRPVVQNHHLLAAGGKSHVSAPFVIAELDFKCIGRQ